MNFRTELRYGEESLDLKLNVGEVIFDLDVRSSPPLRNLKEQVKAGLRNPISTFPIDSMVRAGSKVTIIVDDLTRPTPQSTLIPIILDELKRTGVKDANIKIVIGLGTHRPMNEYEIKDRFGDLNDRFELINHDYKNLKGLLNLGVGEGGFPILINKDVYTSDLVMGIGNITPHMYAGWAGGGKIVAPGVSGEETTGGIHLLGGRTKPALSLIGSVDNKVRRHIDNVALKAGLRLIVNTILNESKQVSGLAIGHPKSAFRRGVDAAKKIYKRPITQLADLVIASSYPADIDYWQAIKGIVTASLAVKPGGFILLVAPCPDGVSPTHKSMTEYGSRDFNELVNLIDEGEITDKTASGTLLYNAQIRERAKIIVYSEGIKEKDAESLGLIYVSNIEEGVELVQESLGRNFKIGVMHNSEIIPTLTRKSS